MSEGTKVRDLSDEIDMLRKRIEILELRPSYSPYPPAAPLIPAPQGCVCPVGAEFGCGNTGCPRRRPYGYGPTC